MSPKETSVVCYSLIQRWVFRSALLFAVFTSSGFQNAFVKPIQPQVLIELLFTEKDDNTSFDFSYLMFDKSSSINGAFFSIIPPGTDLLQYFNSVLLQAFYANNLALVKRSFFLFDHEQIYDDIDDYFL